MRKESSNFLIGTILGAVVGGITAIVLAPATGEETRHRIKEFSGDAKQKAADLKNKGREYIESKRSQFREAVEAGKEAAEEKREELESKLQSQMEETEAKIRT